MDVIRRGLGSVVLEIFQWSIMNLQALLPDVTSVFWLSCQVSQVSLELEALQVHQDQRGHKDLKVNSPKCFEWPKSLETENPLVLSLCYYTEYNHSEWLHTNTSCLFCLSVPCSLCFLSFRSQQHWVCLPYCLCVSCRWCRSPRSPRSPRSICW